MRQLFMLSAAFVLGVTAAGQASAATKEINLASPTQALAYCRSGKMPTNDIAYIAGQGGLAQYGPGANCAQAVPAKGKVGKAIEVTPMNKVMECTMQTATKSLAFCTDGEMGEWDIDYIAGKVGVSISGPGYGCEIGVSTSSLGNAVCK